MGTRLRRPDKRSDFDHKRVTDYFPKPGSDRWVVVSWVGAGLDTGRTAAAITYSCFL